MKGMHVKLDNPVNDRKNILKSAINATKLLKDYEANKGIIVKKSALIERLKTEMGMISNLNKKLIISLPKIEREKPAPVLKEINNIKVEIPKPFKAKPKDKLDLEIEEIESKLKSIEI